MNADDIFQMSEDFSGRLYVLLCCVGVIVFLLYIRQFIPMYLICEKKFVLVYPFF